MEHIKAVPVLADTKRQVTLFTLVIGVHTPPRFCLHFVSKTEEACGVLVAMVTNSPVICRVRGVGREERRHHG